MPPDIADAVSQTPADLPMIVAQPSVRESAVAIIGDWSAGLGDWALFSARAVGGLFTRHLKVTELLRTCYEFGYQSVGVVALTGAFIGMVLAVQAYAQFNALGLETSIGSVIHMSVVRELGPVLAAVMLAGRIGTAMAAQLGTMRVTEQIDAMACLGVDPVRFLVGPRFLASVLMIPLLTALADLMGITGSTLICLRVFHIDPHHYWEHATRYVSRFDFLSGLVKSMIFGGVLSLICCHRGFHSKAGAEGVGRAATQGFVLSFVAILFLDFLLALLTNSLTAALWPRSGARVA
ncbi:MAG: ABC transporter permease [Fimbriiglobus sp.]|nr:ABC transporter permease [Fimbriiglobus sp.]